MKTSQIIIISILIICATAFTTNPNKKQHVDVLANYVMQEISKQDDSPTDKIDLMIDGFVSQLGTILLTQKLQIDNYYLFSVSSSYSEKTKKTINPTIGVFGQVIIIVSDQEWEEYRSK